MSKGAIRSIDEKSDLIKKVEEKINTSKLSISRACKLVGVPRRTYYKYNRELKEHNLQDDRLKKSFHMEGRLFLEEFSILFPVASIRECFKVYNEVFVPGFNNIAEDLFKQNFIVSGFANHETYWRVYSLLQSRGLTNDTERYRISKEVFKRELGKMKNSLNQEGLEFDVNLGLKYEPEYSLVLVRPKTRKLLINDPELLWNRYKSYCEKHKARLKRINKSW